MKLVFLGTSSLYPTKDRNQSSVAFDIGTEMLLFDCGEGTQRQIRIAQLGPMKISKILLTHWHGDHVLGLAGLLQSFHMSKRTKTLDIFGPKNTKERFRNMLKTFSIKHRYPIKVHEIDSSKPKKVFEAKDYALWAINVHHAVPCVAWSWIYKPKIRINKDVVKKYKLSGPIMKKLQQGKDITWKGKKIKAKDATYVKPGKKVTYVVDAASTDAVAKFAKDSDYFICEATFIHALKDSAAERGHMTSKQAGKLAKKAKVKQLIITHFSQRYKNIKPILTEARKQFKNTIAARDFLEVKV